MKFDTILMFQLLQMGNLANGTKAESLLITYSGSL